MERRTRTDRFCLLDKVQSADPLLRPIRPPFLANLAGPSSCGLESVQGRNSGDQKKDTIGKNGRKEQVGISKCRSGFEQYGGRICKSIWQHIIVVRLTYLCSQFVYLLELQRKTARIKERSKIKA